MIFLPPEVDELTDDEGFDDSETLDSSVRDVICPIIDKLFENGNDLIGSESLSTVAEDQELKERREIAKNYHKEENNDALFMAKTRKLDITKQKGRGAFCSFVPKPSNNDQVLGRRMEIAIPSALTIILPHHCEFLLILVSYSVCLAVCCIPVPLDFRSALRLN
ncbi:hypothetical protein NPIL_432601 [Nephila pilipes]|uniref:Uncharacterized protein n=1 Tax=Nephila pilipes TaxID=299642 RepID=A0A8X6TFL8_NEPPI|nr:hypothetical protein NPIL_432601 [Nephila pilipes]